MCGMAVIGCLVSVMWLTSMCNHVVVCYANLSSQPPQISASASVSLNHFTGKESGLSFMVQGPCRLLSLNQPWEGGPTDVYLGQTFVRFCLESVLLQWLMAKVSCLIHL